MHTRTEERIDLFEHTYSILCGGLTIEKLNYANIVFAHFLASFLYSEMRQGHAADTTIHVEGMVSRITHFMSENIESTLTLKQIASFVGYSESYIYRRFVSKMGHAPIDYFIHMKINKASVLLLKTTMCISRMAAKQGFNSPDYFSRTFKCIVGITASDFRKQDFRL